MPRAVLMSHHILDNSDMHLQGMLSTYTCVRLLFLGGTYSSHATSPVVTDCIPQAGVAQAAGPCSRPHDHKLC